MPRSCNPRARCSWISGPSGACRAGCSPTIDEAAADFAGKAKVGKLDTDANREIAEKYQISAIPTVIVFKGGEVHGKFYGLTSRDDLASRADRGGRLTRGPHTPATWPNPFCAAGRELESTRT